jgi:hypothetical protein
MKLQPDQPSCPRKRASSTPQRLRLVADALEYWIPAFAGMTPVSLVDVE